MEGQSGGGSDLPKPRKKNSNAEKPHVYGTLPPLPQSGEMRHTPEPQPRPAPMKKKVSRRNQYASDTAEFTPPPDDMILPEYDNYDDYDYDYDERPVTPPSRRRAPSQRRGYPQQSGAAQARSRRSGSSHSSGDTALPEYDDYHDERPAPSRRRALSPSQRRGYPQQSRHSQPVRSAAPPRRRRRHRSRLLGGLVRWVISAAMVLFGLYSLVSLALISRLEQVGEGTRVNTSGSLDPAYVRSVLLIGTDSRDLTQERGRSDSMILLTFNSRTKEICLNSFMRDAYVQIPGYGNDRLNAAYSYGGAELLMDTLELNFDVSIDDYLCISFTGFAGVIDAFGGVEMTLSDEEAAAVNTILQSEVNALMGDDPMADFLPSGGTFILDGKQALSYARIRYVGNADFERTSRQREVMTQLFSNAKTRMATAAPELMKSALPHFMTNMSTLDLYLLSLRMPLLLGYGMQQQQIPADGTWSGADINGQSVLQIDFAANTQRLRETAYASTKPAEEAQ